MVRVYRCVDSVTGRETTVEGITKSKAKALAAQRLGVPAERLEATIAGNRPKRQ